MNKILSSNAQNALKDIKIYRESMTNHLASKCSLVVRSMTGINLWSTSGFKNSTIRFREALLFSTEGLVTFTILDMVGGHQDTTSLFSLENMNLFPEAPQRTTIFSPAKDVVKT